MHNPFCARVLVSKTLHHLRTGKCIAGRRGSDHRYREDEKCCIYKFEEQEIFDQLIQLGNRMIIYEWFDPTEKDDDKVRGPGGYFTTKEWRRKFYHLSKNPNVEFFRPDRFLLEEGEVENVVEKLRQVDCVCFCAETKEFVVCMEKTWSRKDSKS